MYHSSHDIDGMIEMERTTDAIVRIAHPLNLLYKLGTESHEPKKLVLLHSIDILHKACSP